MDHIKTVTFTLPEYLAEKVREVAEEIGWSKARLIEHIVSEWDKEKYAKFRRTGDKRVITG